MTVLWSAVFTPSKKDSRRNHHSRHGQEKPQRGEALAVGPGKRDETGKLVALDVRQGDQIMFGKWSGTEVEDRWGRPAEDDIMGVVEDLAHRPPPIGNRERS